MLLWDRLMKLFYEYNAQTYKQKMINQQRIECVEMFCKYFRKMLFLNYQIGRSAIFSIGFVVGANRFNGVKDLVPSQA
jgi:hypothetical protein